MAHEKAIEAACKASNPHACLTTAMPAMNRAIARFIRTECADHGKTCGCRMCGIARDLEAQ